jgi:glycosyltransferase involved in cell wall biosynthesis
MINAPISLITTVFNEIASIQTFLDSYRHQYQYADEFIIVDGGSTDGTIETISAYAQTHPELNIRLIIAPECSRAYTPAPIARGRNLAIKNANNEFIAVTDAGCILDPNWLTRITTPLEQADVVAGWYRYNAISPFQRRYTRLMEPSAETVNPMTILPSSRSIAFRKKCWQEVGGYPELSYSGEDTMFDINLHRARYKFAFEPQALVLWTPPLTLLEALKKHRWYSYGDGQLHLRKRLHLMRIVCLLMPFCLLIDPRKRRDFIFAYSILCAQTFGFLAGFISSLGRRSKMSGEYLNYTH